MICQKCGGDVTRTFAGSVEVLRHVVAPREAHYPRLAPSRSGPDAMTPVDAQGRTRTAQPDSSRLDGTPS